MYMYIFELHLEIIRLRSSGICYLSGKTKNNLFLTAYIKTKKHKKCDRNQESQNFQFYYSKIYEVGRAMANSYLRMPL